MINKFILFPLFKFNVLEFNEKIMKNKFVYFNEYLMYRFRIFFHRYSAWKIPFIFPEKKLCGLIHVPVSIYIFP